MINKMELTLQNYHTLENRYLTNSRMGDFRKCKKYFKELHIDGTKTKKMKDTYNVGSAVDAWLTRGQEAFKREFLAVSRRNIKNPPEGYTELTMAQFDEVLAMCEMMEVQPAYLALKDHTAQEIIKYDEPIGEHFCGVSFIPDWYKIEGDTCIITDLKTAANADVRKYHWHCEDFGYYNQMAVATMIFRKNNPGIKNFVYRHLVIEKDGDGVPQPYVYFLDNDRVEVYANVIQNELIPMIASEKEFKAKEVDWPGAPVIGSLDNDFDE